MLDVSSLTTSRARPEHPDRIQLRGEGANCTARAVHAGVCGNDAALTKRPRSSVPPARGAQRSTLRSEGGITMADSRVATPLRADRFLIPVGPRVGHAAVGHANA
jgi:hypothetical protein